MKLIFFSDLTLHTFKKDLSLSFIIPLKEIPSRFGPTGKVCPDDY